jgi:hypothetical protein
MGEPFLLGYSHFLSDISSVGLNEKRTGPLLTLPSCKSLQTG